MRWVLNLIAGDLHLCVGGEGRKATGNNMHGLVGVSHASPPPSAFASAQPPRSVFADAQLPASHSEAENENGPFPAPGTAEPTIRAQNTTRRTSQVCQFKQSLLRMPRL